MTVIGLASVWGLWNERFHRLDFEIQKISIIMIITHLDFTFGVYGVPRWVIYFIVVTGLWGPIL